MLVHYKTCIRLSANLCYPLWHDVDSQRIVCALVWVAEFPIHIEMDLLIGHGEDKRFKREDTAELHESCICRAKGGVTSIQIQRNIGLINTSATMSKVLLYHQCQKLLMNLINLQRVVDPVPDTLGIIHLFVCPEPRAFFCFMED